MNDYFIPTDPPPMPVQDFELHTGQFSASNPNLVFKSLVKTSYGDLVEGYLSPGQNLTLMPANYQHGMIDVFFFAEGEMLAHTNQGPRRLKANSFITTDKLKGKTRLEAHSSVKYLHFLAPPWLAKNENEGKKLEMDEGSFNFAFSRGGIGFTLGTIHAGETLYATPEKEGTIEVYYVLKGLLSLDQEDGNAVVLKPSDYFVARDLSKTLSFFCNTDVTFLYFANASRQNWIENFHGDVIRLAEEVEQKDGYTAEHCSRLQRLSKRTGKLLHLSADRMLKLGLGARLHDLGKVNVPLEILQKPSKLNALEWEVIKKHPTYGRQLLENSNMEGVGIIIEQHHERMDGSGYPFGLKGNEILTESYIVAVADTFDAMTTNRPYRKALSEKTAFEELNKYADKHYPKVVVDAFIEANKLD